MTRAQKYCAAVSAFNIRWEDGTSDISAVTEALTITTWWTRYCGGIRVCTGVAAWLLLHRGLCHSSISSLLVFYLLVSRFCSDCCYFCWFCCCYCFHTTHHQSCAAKVRHLMHCTAASTTFWPVWENVGTVALERRGGGGYVCFEWEKTWKQILGAVCVNRHKVIFLSQYHWREINKRRLGDDLKSILRSHNIRRQIREAQTLDYNTLWQLTHKATL